MNDQLAPAEIWIYLTDPARDTHAGPAHPAEQWDFEKWMHEAASRWADKEITLYIVSFDAGLTRNNLLCKLRRPAEAIGKWRIILVTDGKDLTNTAMIDRILRCGLDELQVYPAPPGAGEIAVNPRVLNAVKDLVDLRRARRQNLPRIVCRLCATGKAADDLAQWARQVNIDRLELVDGPTEEKRLWDL